MSQPEQGQNWKRKESAQEWHHLEVMQMRQDLDLRAHCIVQQQWTIMRSLPPLQLDGIIILDRSSAQVWLLLRGKMVSSNWHSELRTNILVAKL